MKVQNVKTQKVKFLVDQDGEFGSRKKDEEFTLSFDLAKILKDRKIVKFVTSKKGVDNGGE